MCKQFLILLAIPTIAFGQSIGTQTNTDNFNRANETPLSGGGNWTSTTNRVDLISNQVTTAGTGSDREAVYAAWANGNDQYSQLKVTVSGTTAGAGFGVSVRSTTTGSTFNCYRVVLNSDGEYEVCKMVSSSCTSLRTGTLSYVAGTALGLSVLSTTLKVWYGGTQVGADITDSGIASGKPGIAYSSTLSVVPTGDDWDAGTTAAAATNKSKFFLFFGTLCHINFFER